jgi:hypothetical protein
LIIYYSGFGCSISNPEVCLAERATIMLSFSDSRKKPHPRFAAVHEARKEGRRGRLRHKPAPGHAVEDGVG